MLLGELLGEELFPTREGDLTLLTPSSSSMKLVILRIGEVIEVKELSLGSLLLLSLRTGGGMKRKAGAGRAKTVPPDSTNKGCLGCSCHFRRIYLLMIVFAN